MVKEKKNVNSLLASLNEKQKLYVNLNLKNPESGKYLLTAFHLLPGKKLNILQAASEVAAESSTGTNFRVKTETALSRKLNAIVYKIDLKNNIVWIAYPWRIFDREGNVQNILTFIVGNNLSMKEVSALKLLDVWFPKRMLKKYDGPSYNLENVRKYLNVYNRPILGTIIKPKIGLNAKQYAKICYEFWVGGGDFVKNDEPQANQDFCPYTLMVKYVKKAMERAVKETGKKKIHSFNVSSPDFDTMIERCELIKKAGFEKGSYAFLIDGVTSGWTAVQTLRRRYPNVFIHFHRASHGAYTRQDNPFGFSVLVLSKFARLAGASGMHTGTAGVGKMEGSPEEDIIAAKNISTKDSQGHFFKQSWGRMKKCCPIISGGLNPTLLEPFIKTMGNTEFITTMGAGCHAHPKGTRAGAKSIIQAFEAYQKSIKIKEYAKTHQELAESIEFFGKIQD
jgi:ribulose-bisphosphate carboxylase large chain